jgi:hypothetical protein
MECEVIFAYYTPEQIGVSADQMTWFKGRGYDMDSWSNGELLVINHKMPESRLDEAVEEIAREIEASAASNPAATAPP